MNEKYLIVNAGSSSLKFSLYTMPDKNEIVNGLIERIGANDSCYTLKFSGGKIEKSKKIISHVDAAKTMFDELLNNGFIDSLNEIKGVGHRVLHGGEFYKSSVVITEEVKRNIKALEPLGPLHHPAELGVIECIENYLPGVSNIAVFDTAFHQTIPDYNYTYPVPYELYELYGVRKYGFHGTSHNYITEVMQKKLNRKNINIISIHTGNGCSISAIKNGKCIDTTMGLTPLDGLMMGTRSGAIDPSIIEYVSKCTGMSLEEVTNMLNKKSGLLGISGKSDFRDVEKGVSEQNKLAILAYEMFKRSIIKYIAQYYFELEGNIDAIIFTAGIGENSIGLRENIVNELSKTIDVKLNKEANNNIARFKEYTSGAITTPDSKIDILVIPTDEEYMILRDTYNICKQDSNKKNKVKTI